MGIAQNIINVIFRADTADLDQAKKSLTGLGSAADAVGGPISDVANQLNDLRDRAAKFAEALGGADASLGTVAAGAAVATVALGALAGAAVISFTPLIRELDILGKALGTNATHALIFKSVLESGGSDAEKYADVVKTVSEAVVDAADTASDQARAFKNLGIEYTTATTKAELASAATKKYHDLVKAGNLTSQAQVDLQRILGDNLAEATTAVDLAAQAQAEYNDAVSKGLGITQESITATNDWTVAARGFDVVMTTVKSVLTADVLPSFTALTTAFNESYAGGGLVKVMFDGLRIGLQVLLVPVRVIIDAFIALDTMFRIVALSVTSLFKVIATESGPRLENLGEKIDAILQKSADLVKQNTYWSAGDQTNAAAAGATTTANQALGRAATPQSALDKSKELNQQINDILDAQFNSVLKTQGVDLERMKIASDLLKIEQEALQVGDLKAAAKAREAVDAAQANYDAAKALSLQQELVSSAQAMLTAKTNEAALAAVESTTLRDRLAIQQQFAPLIEKASKDGDLMLVTQLRTLEVEAARQQAKIRDIELGKQQKQLDEELLQLDEERKRTGEQIMRQTLGNDFGLTKKSTSAYGKASEEINAQLNSIREQYLTVIGALEKRKSIAEATIGKKDEVDALAEQIKANQELMGQQLTLLNDQMKEAHTASTSAWAGIVAGAKAFGDELPTLNVAMADFTQNTLQSFSDRLANVFITGKFGFKDFVRSAIEDLIRLQTRMMAVKVFSSFAGGAAGGGHGPAFASGGVFDHGVTKFANGDIFNQTTPIRYAGGAGVIGEAGPEAVMPLRRNGAGQLGVMVNDGGKAGGGINIGGVSITVQAAKGETADQTGQRVGEAFIRTITQSEIVKQLGYGGSIYTSMRR